MLQVATMQQELGALQPVLADKSAATEKLLHQVSGTEPGLQVQQCPVLQLPEATCAACTLHHPAR